MINKEFEPHKHYFEEIPSERHIVAYDSKNPERRLGTIVGICECEAAKIWREYAGENKGIFSVLLSRDFFIVEKEDYVIR